MQRTHSALVAVVLVVAVVALQVAAAVAAVAVATAEGVLDDWAQSVRGYGRHYAIQPATSVRSPLAGHST